MTMTLSRTCLLLLMTGGWVLPSACGGSSLDQLGEKGGEAGVGAVGGSAGDGAASGTSGSSSGGSGAGATGGGGSGGSGGDGVGATGGVGGSGGTGGVGGGGGTGGGVGGAGGSGGGSGGVGGSAAGAGGSAAGAGGSVAGAGGCGVCPFIACAPAISINVTAPADIVDLTGEVTNAASGATVGTLQCYAIGVSGTCGWHCDLFALGLQSGDYAINLYAPSYLDETVPFQIEQPSNCGCCGCGCGGGFSGTVGLEPSGAAAPACCAALQTDQMNCGTCGHACVGEPCVKGECGGT
jgi:hypothetical protein